MFVFHTAVDICHFMSPHFCKNNEGKNGKTQSLDTMQRNNITSSERKYVKSVPHARGRKDDGTNNFDSGDQAFAKKYIEESLVWNVTVPVKEILKKPFSILTNDSLIWCKRRAHGNLFIVSEILKKNTKDYHGKSKKYVINDISNGSESKIYWQKIPFANICNQNPLLMGIVL